MEKGEEVERRRGGGRGGGGEIILKSGQGWTLPVQSGQLLERGCCKVICCAPTICKVMG